jgi:hypothetical protein
MPVHGFKRLDSVVLLNENLAKIKMAANGHLHFDNSYVYLKLKEIPP